MQIHIPLRFQMCFLLTERDRRTERKTQLKTRGREMQIQSDRDMGCMLLLSEVRPTRRGITTLIAVNEVEWAHMVVG